MAWWGPHNPLGIAIGLVAVVLAVTVYRGAPNNRTNRLAALVLALEGFVLIGGGLYAFTQDGPFLLYMGTGALLFCLVSLYPRLVSTLNTPLARPFRGPSGLAILVGSAAVVIAANQVLGWTEHLTDQGQSVPEVMYTLRPIATAVAGAGLVVGLLGVGVYALVVAASAYRRTPVGSVERLRAKSWVIAFGTRDALWVLHALVFLGVASTIGDDAWFAQALWIWGPPLYVLVYASLLAYGILRTQLFDIDLKLKWGIRRGTAVSILIVAALVASKITEIYVTREVGYVAGGVAAGLLLFAAPRLNKIGDKVAQKAMPNVQNTSAYLEFRRLEVYQAALQSAQESGGITPKERDTLNRLRAKLGISEADAARVEADLMPAPTVTPTPSRAAA